MGISKHGNMHVCMVCGYKAKKSHVMVHYQVKHLPQVESSCHVCQKVFKNSYYRDIHRRQVHGITREMMQASCQVPPSYQSYGDNYSK